MKQAHIGLSAFVLLALLPAVALAQLPSPEIETIFPPGGKAGTSFEVELTGTDLDDLTELRFTHAGITAQPVMLLADEIWPEPRQDGLKFTVRIADNVPAGRHEVRSFGRYGLSTPRFFVVSTKDGPDELTAADGNETVETAIPIELEQAVSGQTTSNRSDHYKLSVRKGQRVLVHVWGERIDSRIDGILSVLDPSGKEIAASLNEIGLDPLGDFTAPADGDYIIKVSDYLFNGGPPYFYRLKATTAPWLDGVFPRAGKPGTRQKFTVYGRNLPGGKPSGVTTANGDRLETKEVEIQIPRAGQPAPVNGGKIFQWIAEGFDFREGNSNSLRIGLARDELIVEDANADEQVVKAPCEVAGRFDKRGDQDVYRFSANKDEELVIDVIADRMAIAADPTLILQQIVKPAPDAAEQKVTNKFIAEADDIVLKSPFVQGAEGFASRSRDARLLFTAPEDGEYRIVLGNNMGHHGALAPYRLGIRKARPGFQLIAVQDKIFQEGRNAMPGVMRVHAGGTSFIRVLALREDGFDSPIELSVSGLPTGAVAPPVSIWGPNDEGYLAVTASSHAWDWQGEVTITGKATVDGKPVSVPARAGTLVWSATDPARNRTRSRLTNRFALQVSSEPAELIVQPKEAKIWRAEIRKTLDLPVKLTKQGTVKGPFRVTPYGLPGFIRPPALNVPGEEGVLKVSFVPNANAQPVAGEGKFVLRMDGLVGQHRINPEAAEYWAARKKEIDALYARWNAAKRKADSAVNSANNFRASTETALTNHANTRKQLAQALANAQTKHDAAKELATEAAAATKSVPDAWLAVAKFAHAANQNALPALLKAVADAKTKFEAAKKNALAAEAALAAEVAADEKNRNDLQQAVQAAKDSLKTSRDAVAAAEKALAAHLAPRVALANAAADAEIRLRVAKQAAGVAAAEIVQVTAEHQATAKVLADAKTKADAALKAPEQALADATKAVTLKEAEKVATEKALAEAKTKAEAMKKAAADAGAAVTAAIGAHDQNLKKLTAEKTNADKMAKEATTALEAAKKALAANTNEDPNVKASLTKAVADAQARATPAMKAATDAAAAIQTATTAHNANLAKLTAAKTKAETDAKTAETGVTAAGKPIANAETALVALKKTQAEAQTRFDEAKKVADEAAAAIPAAQKSQADQLAKLNATRDATAQAVKAAEPSYAAAAKQLSNHDAKQVPLEKALADAKAKIDPARAALADAEAKLLEVQRKHEPALVKLTTDKRTADLALAAAEIGMKSASQTLAENQAAAPLLAKAQTEAQAAVDAATAAATAKAEAAAKVAAAAKAATDAEVAAAARAATDAKTIADTRATEATKAAAEAKTVADAKMAADTKATANAKAAAEAKTAADAKAAEAAKAAADPKIPPAAKAAAAKAAADAKAVEAAKTAEATKAATDAKAAADAKTAADAKAVAATNAATDAKTAANTMAAAATKLAADTKAAAEAKAAADAKAAAEAKAVAGAKATELTTAANKAKAALPGAIAAFTAAKQALDANDAAKPLLEKAVSEAKARAEADKAEAERLAELVTKVNAARTLAQRQEQAARTRANPRDRKFTVYSEPIDLRVLEPPVSQ